MLWSRSSRKTNWFSLFSFLELNINHCAKRSSEISFPIKDSIFNLKQIINILLELTRNITTLLLNLFCSTFCIICNLLFNKLFFCIAKIGSFSKKLMIINKFWTTWVLTLTWSRSTASLFLLFLYLFIIMQSTFAVF